MKTFRPSNPAAANAAVKYGAAVIVLVVAQLVVLPSVAFAQGKEAITNSASLPDYVLLWSDEFDGNTLDASKWTCRTDSKNLSTQKPENVVVKDGLLRLTLKKKRRPAGRITLALASSVWPRSNMLTTKRESKCPPETDGIIHFG